MVESQFLHAVHLSISQGCFQSSKSHELQKVIKLFINKSIDDHRFPLR